MTTRNKALIITGLVILGIALVIFLISLALLGWDFKAFFTSSTFIWICVLFGLYILAIIIILVEEWYKRL